MPPFSEICGIIQDGIAAAFGIQVSLWEAFGAGVMGTFFSVFVFFSVTRLILLRASGGIVSSFFGAESDGASHDIPHDVPTHFIRRR